jgi:hypothetical protein
MSSGTLPDMSTPMRSKGGRARALVPALAPGLALAGLLAGCDDRAPSEAGFRVDTLGGVEHTVAADAPVQGDQGLELLWQAPSEAEVREGSAWANPTRIAVNDRHVAVLDPQLSRVHLFTPEGERSASFGRRGEGPGEFSRPATLEVYGDSVLVMNAFASPPFQWFGPDGSYLGALGAPIDGVGAAAYFLDRAGILRQVVDLEATATSAMGWELMEFSGARHRVELPGDHSLQPQDAEGGSTCWRHGTAGAGFLQLACALPLVRIVDARGRVLREHRIDRAPQRTPDHLVEAAIERIEAEMRGSAEDVPAAMAGPMIERLVASVREQLAWMPIMHSAAGSRSGHRIVLVEQLPEEIGGGGATLHLLDAEGRYLLRHDLGRPVRSLALSDAQLVVLVQDPDTGLRRLEAYRLP